MGAARGGPFGGPVGRRPRAALAAALAAALGAAALAAGPLAGCRPFARDPSPRYWRPAPAVHAATADSATREGASLVQAVRLEAAGGLTVDVLVKRPAPDSAAGGGAARPAPLVLVLGGKDTGRRAAHLVPDTRGYVVAALSYPYDGPPRPRGLLGALRAAPAVRRASVRTPEAVHVALDWLLAQPYVDGRRVEGVGVSLGVPYMTAAAATDPRVTRVWAVQGGGRSRLLLRHNAGGAVPGPLRGPVAWAADALLAGPRLTPERWAARVSPRPFVMVNAEHDERIPRAAVLALYDAARPPKTLIWTPGRHVRPDRPELVRALVDTLLLRLGPADSAAAPARSAER